MSVQARTFSDDRRSDFAPDAGRAWRTGLTSTGIAVVVNLVILGVARLTGAAMVVQPSQDAAAMTIGVGAVVVTVAVPMLVATLLLLTVRRWGARAWRALATAGLV